jgi:hypothetical protein
MKNNIPVPPVRFVNLTPHAVVLLDKEDRPLATVPPSGTLARVSVSRTETGLVPLTDNPRAVMEGWPGSGFPVFVSQYGEVTGLPPTKVGTIYLVSTLVRLAVPRRRDVLSPCDLVRDAAGQTLGCRGLEANR